MARWIYQRPIERCDPTELLVAKRLALLSDGWVIHWGFYYDSDREGDFLILGPTGGVLVLEVKGGELRKLSTTGRWEGPDRDHPLTQLSAEWHAIIVRLQETADGNAVPFVAKVIGIPVAKIAAPAVTTPAATSTKSTAAVAPKQPKPEEKKWAMSGRRDPFFSPVVQQNGSGCATGKKCLEIGAINLRGVVKSDAGFIAVVTNNLNKAYFLRENDPVFNGYVVKITGDSVVFQETIQDKLGKSFTREVVKRIFTPAV